MLHAAGIQALLPNARSLSCWDWNKNLPNLFMKDLMAGDGQSKHFRPLDRGVAAAMRARGRGTLPTKRYDRTKKANSHTATVSIRNMNALQINSPMMRRRPCRSALEIILLCCLTTFGTFCVTLVEAFSASTTKLQPAVRCSQQLYMSKLDPSGRGLKKGESNIPGSDDEDGGVSAIPIRYLGKGERAIIRPGVVMVAPAHESSHFLMKSAVFVYAMGLDAYGEYVTRGVIIDHPTAFTMGEMGGGSVVGTLANNILFRGGDAGNDSALMLHSNDKIVDKNTVEPIGNSGLYEGGLSAAMEAADEGEIDSESCKFFFNYVQFTDNEIENILQMEDTVGDAWCSCEVPADFVLNCEYGRGEAWGYLRNRVKQMMAGVEEEKEE